MTRAKWMTSSCLAAVPFLLIAACGSDPPVDADASTADAGTDTAADGTGIQDHASPDAAVQDVVTADAPDATVNDVGTDVVVMPDADATVVDAPPPDAPSKDVTVDTAKDSPPPDVVVDAPADVVVTPDAPANCTTMPKMKLTPIISSGLSQPLYMTSPPGDNTRLFIVEKGGKIKLFKNGTLLSTAFLDITSRVLVQNQAAEGGLLGLAFHPNYATNRKFYVHYTAQSQGNVVIAEYTATSGGDTANMTETRIIDTSHGGYNHCGGQLAFGPGGYLYASIGDGGDGVPGQSPASQLNQSDAKFYNGKILRIDTNNLTTPPSGNKISYIWDWGLRNPWRFSFDRGNNDLYIADVGKTSWEEIDVEPAGSSPRNYGWDTMEGNHCYSPSSGCSSTGITLPAVEHPRTEAASIIGGYVYRGSKMTCMQGRYIYTDYVTNKFFSFVWNGSSATSKLDLSDDLNPNSSITGLASFGEDADGELYVASVVSGRVYKIELE